jgi:hypothetical protein
MAESGCVGGVLPDEASLDSRSATAIFGEGDFGDNGVLTELGKAVTAQFTALSIILDSGLVTASLLGSWRRWWCGRGCWCGGLGLSDQ